MRSQTDTSMQAGSLCAMVHQVHSLDLLPDTSMCAGHRWQLRQLCTSQRMARHRHSDTGLCVRS